MKLMLVFHVLYFVQVGHYTNNPSACFSCMTKFIENSACAYLGGCDPNHGGDNGGNDGNGGNNGGNGGNGGNNGGNGGNGGNNGGNNGNSGNNGGNGGNNGNNMNPITNINNNNNVNTNVNTNINTNTNINNNNNNNGNSNKDELEKKVIDILDNIKKTIINIWENVFDKSDNNDNKKNNSDNKKDEDSKKNDDKKGKNDDNKGKNYDNKKDIDDKKKDDATKDKGGITDPDVINLINQFFAKLSENQVKNILIQGPKGVMIDEVYVTGLWDIAFDPKKTKSRSFYLTTRTVMLPTMNNKAVYKYGISDELDASLLEIPFDDGNGSLLIILPNSPDGIVDLMNMLQTPPLLDTALSKMEPTNVNLFLPKFNVEAMFDIKIVLGKIAIPGVALRAKSKFQKVHIEVNEEGKGGSRRYAAPALRDKVTQFKVQWPFYYEVRFYKKPLFNGVYGVK